MNAHNSDFPLVSTIINVAGRDENAEVEKYAIIRGLGRGGFGTVYLGQGCTSNFKVAVKVIDAKRAVDIQRANKEISIQKQLLGRYIVQLYSWCRIENAFYLLLDYCENGNLKNYLKQQPDGKLPESEASKFLFQIVGGLKFLHKRNIMHGDISLNNLLLTEDHTIKIADFGFALQLRGPNDVDDTRCGQESYMAPEKLDKLYGLPSDIWSVGCVFCYMITGQLPNDISKKKTFPMKPTSEEYQIFKKISPAALDLLSKMLRTDPAQRIKSLDISSHPFFVSYKKFNMEHQSVSGMDSGIEANGCSSSPSISNNFPSYPRKKSPQINIGEFKMKKSSPILPSPIKTTGYYSGNSLQSTNTGNAIKDIREGLHLMNGIKCGDGRFNSANARSNSPLRSPILNLNDNSQDGNFNLDIHRLNNRSHVEEWRSQSYNCNDNQRPMNFEKRNCSYGSADHSKGLQTNSRKLNAIRTSSERPSYRSASRQSNSKMAEQPMFPLDTTRLSPQEYSTAAGTKKIRISSNGHVIVELAERLNADVFDCCDVSGNGKEIIVYEIVKGKRHKPVTFTFENLPSKHFYKYNTADKFCSIVRSKTLKIRYRHTGTKYELMENADFKASGLFNTKEMTLSKSNNMISITYPDDTKVEASLADFSCDDSLLNTFKKFHGECLKIEKATMELNPSMFPVICGPIPKPNKKLANKENVNLRR